MLPSGSTVTGLPSVITLRTHSLCLVGAVHREHAAQAPADQADLAPALVVPVADLLLERRGMAGPEADIASHAPGVHA